MSEIRATSVRNWVRGIAVASFSLMAVGASTSHAAVITAEPVDTTTQANWVTAGYAADGYALFNTSPNTSSPYTGDGFFGDPLASNHANATTLLDQPTSIGLTISSIAGDNFGGYGYPNIQDPTNPTSQVQAGLAGYNGNTSGQSYDLFALTAGSSVSAITPIRVVVISIGTAASYTLTETTGAVTGLLTETSTIADATVSPFSYYIFDITGAANGDVYTLSAVSNGNTLISGLGFSTVPEPASLGIISVAALGLLKRRRFAV
jgi:hypothetical protein